MPSFGQQLRRERKEKQVSLQQVADATKIGVRYLRALESDEFDDLPGGVFDRGYVRAYAQFVGLDPDAAVEAFLEERARRGAPEREETSLEDLRSAVLARPAGHGGAREAFASMPGAGRAVLRVATAVACLALLSVGVWALVGYFRDASAVADGASAVKLASDPIGSAAASAPADRAPSGHAENLGDPTVPPSATGEHREASRTADAQLEAPPAIAGSASRSPSPTTMTTSPPVESPPARPPVSATGTRRRPSPIEARLVVDRPVSGRANCDNRQVEVLDGMRAGTVLDLHCRLFLLLDATDGGALRLGLDGETPARLVADGEPLRNFKIYP